MKQKGDLLEVTTYNTKGTCAKEISFDLQDGIVKNVNFKGGCPGNLVAISSLIEGMPATEVVKKLQGITCGEKTTSCSDQLAKALLVEMNK